MLRPQLAERRDLHGRGRQRRGGDRARATQLRGGFYDALVGIGGGRTLDVAKYAASRSGAADGRGRHEPRPRRHRLAGRLAARTAGARARYGVQMPIAVVVDLDYVRRSEPGDAPLAASATRSRNLSAIADWRLAERERGEAVDGVAVTFARTAAMAILHREDGDRRRRLPDRARRGARALRAGDGDRRARSRPCSGGDHEILHAIDHLFPGTAHHGELAGAASAVHGVPARRRRARPREIDALPAPPRAAAHAGRPRADRRAVRRGRRARAATRGRTATRSSSTSPSTRPERARACRRVRRSLRSLSCARRRSRRRSSSATAASTGRGGSTCAASRRT